MTGLHWFTRFALWITGDDLDVALRRNDGTPRHLTTEEFRALQRRGDAAADRMKRKLDRRAPQKGDAHD